MTEQTVYSDEEWGLLVGLPQSVVVAASSVETDGGRRTQTERTAGMDAIADGREAASPLIARVATELTARAGDPESGEEAPVIQLADREAGIADLLTRAGEAAALLAEREDVGESTAYKHWLVTIAEAVVAAAKSGGVLGIGGDWVSDSERRFIDELRAILGD